MPSLSRLAYSTLFPVTLELDLSEDLVRFLGNGGRSILFGEDATEYASGNMSAQRVANETSEKWRSAVGRARGIAGPLLVALDEDISAVHRLHRLTPSLPSLAEAQSMSSFDVTVRVRAVAEAARELGVNLFLSPTADIVFGRNDWLTGRTLGSDVSEVSRLVTAYVQGVEAAGIASTLKHFPGHPVLEGIPAIEDAHVPLSMLELRPYLGPFKAGIACGASAVLMGPAIFDGLESPCSGSISSELIGMLRQDLGFKGLVITCDLDHRSTMQNNSIEETVVRALVAGADLLLLSPRSIPAIPNIALAVAEAVESGRLPLARLESAAAAIDKMINRVHH